MKFWENVQPPKTFHKSRVPCHVTCHVSHVTYHMSHVIYLFLFLFFFFRQSGEAYWWRVCYQRGLPCLVYSGGPPPPSQPKTLGAWYKKKSLSGPLAELRQRLWKWSNMLFKKKFFSYSCSCTQAYRSGNHSLKLPLDGAREFPWQIWPHSWNFCLPFVHKKVFFYCFFLLILGYFWCSVVKSVAVSSNLSKLKKKKKKKTKFMKSPY